MAGYNRCCARGPNVYNGCIDSVPQAIHLGCLHTHTNVRLRWRPVTYDRRVTLPGINCSFGSGFNIEKWLGLTAHSDRADGCTSPFLNLPTGFLPSQVPLQNPIIEVQYPKSKSRVKFQHPSGKVQYPIGKVQVQSSWQRRNHIHSSDASEAGGGWDQAGTYETMWVRYRCGSWCFQDGEDGVQFNRQLLHATVKATYLI